jgi:glycosyltransferase involved in cell wall biosynthesis
MKILMVISQFHPIVGGVERQAQLLAKKLIEKGIRVDLITGWWKFGTSHKEMIDGISVVRNFCGWGIFGLNKHRTIRVLGGVTYVISLSLFLILYGRKYDLIHVHQFLYPAFVSVLIGKKLLKMPVLVKSASSGSTSDIERLRQLPFGYFQLNFLLKELDYLVIISGATGKDFNQIGYFDSQISYIPNGVEIPVTGKTTYSHVIRVITITRLSQEKGVDVLLRAWADVIREEKGLRLLIVGYGSLDSYLKSLSCSLDIAQSVDHIGMVQDASKYLKESDLFILPSRSEGMSNALLEAMSYGIPCVATKVGGNDELLGGGTEEILRGGYVLAKNGLLINPDDVEGLTKAILYFIRDERAREEVGKRARKFIQENHSIDLVAERYITLYKSVLSSRLEKCVEFAEK